MDGPIYQIDKILMQNIGKSMWQRVFKHSFDWSKISSRDIFRRETRASRCCQSSGIFVFSVRKLRSFGIPSLSNDDFSFLLLIPHGSTLSTMFLENPQFMVVHSSTPCFLLSSNNLIYQYVETLSTSLRRSRLLLLTSFSRLFCK